MEADIQKLLLKKAGAFLARRSCSRGELRSKLERYADKKSVEMVLDRLASLNLLNEEEYAYNFALRRIQQQGWSPAKAEDSLRHRQVDQHTIDLALARIRNENVEKGAIDTWVRQYCEKKGLPSGPKNIRRFVLHLRRRGFNEDEIFDALRRAIPDPVMKSFETGE